MKQRGKKLGTVLACVFMLAAAVLAVPAQAGAGLVTDQETVLNAPRRLQDLETKWTAAVGEGWSNATTSPIEIDGTIYVLGGGRLKAVNAATGEIERVASEECSNGYNYHLTSGTVNGKTLIFVQCKKTVSAYDTQLNRVWVSEAASYGSDGYCPLYFEDGIIYGMTSAYQKSSSAFAIDGATGAYVWQTEIPFTASVQGSYAMSGSYWAKMAGIGDYVVSGSEGGTVYVFRKSDGQIADSRNLIADYSANIRSGMVYDDGNLYFTTTNGYIYRMAFDSVSGRLGADEKNLVTPTVTNCTATPVLYGGRIYVACSDTDAAGKRQGAVAVLNKTDLSLIYEAAIPTTSEYGSNKCTEVTLAIDEREGAVYGYAMYYETPGAFLGFRDQAGQTAAEMFDARALLPEECRNYSSSLLLMGSDGNLYFTNDSGYLVCVGNRLMMTEGDGSKIKADGKTDLVFRSNAPIEEFLRVEVDGEVLDPSCYTLREGSTVVTLKAAYLATLSEGEHFISIVSKNGSADASFTVTKEKEAAATDGKTDNAQPDAVPQTSPKTGDNDGLAIYLAAAAVLLGAAGTVWILDIRRQNNYDK